MHFVPLVSPAMMVDPGHKGEGRPKRVSDVPLAGCRRLDSASPVPLYWQLAATLHENLEAGTWPEGARFATERELEEEFGVSRAVVRRALDFLDTDGMIVRVKGSGAFVAPRRHRVQIFGLVRSIWEYGSELSLSALTIRELRPDPAVAGFLEMEVGEDVVAHVTAVMRFAGQPVGLADTHVPVDRVPWLLPAIDALRSGTRLPELHGFEVGRAEVLVEQTFFGPWGGPKMGASPGEPALMGHLVQYGRRAGEARERPLEFAHLFYRSASTQLAFELD